jgi:hypothetical protein
MITIVKDKPVTPRAEYTLEENLSTLGRLAEKIYCSTPRFHQEPLRMLEVIELMKTQLKDRR